METNPPSQDSLIRRTRKQKGMSLADVADKVGVSKQEVSMWELRQRTPDVYHLYALGKALDLPLNDIAKDLLRITN